MKIYLYILRSEKDSGFYIGISKDPNKRIEEHNSYKGISTKSRAPFKMIITKEFNSYKEARSIEKVLKHYSKAKIQQFINKILINLGQH